MVEADEIRTKAVAKLNQLINDEITSDEASRWAESEYFSENNKSLIDKSVSLSELFDDLIISSTTHDGVIPMYTKDSFITWLQEYEELYADEKS